jgi:hypothetical protein
MAMGKRALDRVQLDDVALASHGTGETPLSVFRSLPAPSSSARRRNVIKENDDELR